MLPCVADACRYCKKREVQKGERLQQEARCTVVGIPATSANQGLTAVDAAVWERKKCEDSDITPARSWVLEQHRPPYVEIGLWSRATKGLWLMFENLRLCDGVLQRG